MQFGASLVCSPRHILKFLSRPSVGRSLNQYAHTCTSPGFLFFYIKQNPNSPVTGTNLGIILLVLYLQAVQAVLAFIPLNFFKIYGAYFANNIMLYFFVPFILPWQLHKEVVIAHTAQIPATRRGYEGSVRPEGRAGPSASSCRSRYHALLCFRSFSSIREDFHTNTRARTCCL